jgi:hypothetical protein
VVTWGGKKVHVWDSATGKPAFHLDDFPALVQSVEFSPDGLYLAACCADNQINKWFAQVWNTVSGQTVGPRLWHGDGVLCSSFSPDGKRLVTGGEDFMAMIWEVATGRLLVAMRHPGSVGSAAFSPDGKWVVTVCADTTARVWSAATGDPLTPPLRGLANPTHAAFLPDSRRLVSADADGRAWVWELPLDQTPVADLGLLTHFLTGDSATPQSVSPGQQIASHQALWRRLHIHYPAAFTVSAEQVMAWHENKARENEAAGQWFAAAFHWQQLSATRPGDQTYAEHLKLAKDQLKNAH